MSNGGKNKCYGYPISGYKAFELWQHLIEQG